MNFEQCIFEGDACFPQVVVGVHVLDINDNDPVLLNLPHNTSVSEGAAIHTSVARIHARDADNGRNALLTYNITAGNIGGAFYINDTVRWSWVWKWTGLSQV